jgi:hypothetical protein
MAKRERLYLVGCTMYMKIKKNVYNDVEYFSTKYCNHTKMLAILEPKFKVKKEPISYVST